MKGRCLPAGLAITIGLLVCSIPIASGVEHDEAYTETQGTMNDLNDDPIRGKTFRWTFDEGPTANILFEHVFHDDGSLVWRAVDGPMEGAMGEEDEYAAVKIDDHIYTVSYLAQSGHTLTVILNFETMYLNGFASNDAEWHVVSGTFEVVE